VGAELFELDGNVVIEAERRPHAAQHICRAVMMLRSRRNNVTEGNYPELHPEETVDRLEAEALRAEAPHSKALVEETEEGDDASGEPAFDQDMEVEDLPGGPGEGGGIAPEPPC
jgi:hypothetical protein